MKKQNMSMTKKRKKTSIKREKTSMFATDAVKKQIRAGFLRVQMPALLKRLHDPAWLAQTKLDERTKHLPETLRNCYEKFRKEYRSIDLPHRKQRSSEPSQTLFVQHGPPFGISDDHPRTAPSIDTMHFPPGVISCFRHELVNIGEVLDLGLERISLLYPTGIFGPSRSDGNGSMWVEGASPNVVNFDVWASSAGFSYSEIQLFYDVGFILPPAPCDGTLMWRTDVHRYHNFGLTHDFEVFYGESILHAVVGVIEDVSQPVPIIDIYGPLGNLVNWTSDFGAHIFRPSLPFGGRFDVARGQVSEIRFLLIATAAAINGTQHFEGNFAFSEFSYWDPNANVGYGRGLTVRSWGL